MLKFCIKRILIMIPILIGITFIVFSIMDLAPGDPARMIAGEHATEEEVAQLRENMGLNKPMLERYGDYMLGVVRLDFGNSYRTNNRVSEELHTRIPTTLKLTVLSLLLAVVVGVPVGIIAACKRNKLFDTISSICAVVVSSIPSFWLGLILMLVFSLILRLLPSIGSDSWKNFIMPSIALAAGSVGTIIRMTRASALDIISQDFIRTSRAKGVKNTQVIIKHVLRNSLLPVITVIGLNISSLMGGAIVTENVFGMSGIGVLLVESVNARDIPQVMGCTIFIAVIICVVNLVVDLLYTFIDPRLRIKN